MHPAQAYLLGLAVLLVAASALILLVRRPLHAILVELCGAEHRATFWERLYAAAVVLSVLFFSFWVPPVPADGSATTSFEDYFGLLRAGSFALLASLGVLAVLMLLFISKHDRLLLQQEGREPQQRPASDRA